jgi:hypothetical protein
MGEARVEASCVGRTGAVITPGAAVAEGGSGTDGLPPEVRRVPRCFHTGISQKAASLVESGMALGIAHSKPGGCGRKS